MRNRHGRAAPDSGSAQRATREFFHLRRIRVVDAWWALSFALGFALAGILALGSLVDELIRSPAGAMFRYIATICLTGLACSMVGAAIGHAIATIWDWLDVRRHPRRYEPD